MGSGAILSLAALGVIFALFVWRVVTLRDGPEGHTLLGTFFEFRAANAARAVLEGAGIKVILEDPRSRLLSRITAMPWGSVSLFVPTEDAQKAALVLNEAAKAHQHGPPA